MGISNTYPNVSAVNVYGEDVSGAFGKVALGHGVGKIPVFINFQGSGNPGLLLTGRLPIARAATAANDGNDLQVQRTANYTGGTNGNVNSALGATTSVAGGCKTYEWTASFVLDNSSTTADGSQNVALSFMTKKHASGLSWGAIGQMQDQNGADPIGASVCVELDLAGDGTDAHNQRVVLDLVCVPFTNVGSGGSGVISYGARVAGGGGGTCTWGWSVGNNVTVGFHGYGSTPGGTLLDDIGSRANGIDLSAATYTGAPLIAPLTTPASSAAAGKAGSILWDAGFIYICTATNVWKRAALATF